MHPWITRSSAVRVTHVLCTCVGHALPRGVDAQCAWRAGTLTVSARRTGRHRGEKNSAGKISYFELVQISPRFFSVLVRIFSCVDERTPSSTKQTQMVKFNSLKALALKNDCRLLCCVVRLFGMAIPGSLSFQCTQELGGAEFSP